MLLLVVKGEKKSNLNREFKLELITIYHLWFIMKEFWKCCECIISLTLLLATFKTRKS